MMRTKSKKKSTVTTKTDKEVWLLIVDKWKTVRDYVKTVSVNTHYWQLAGILIFVILVLLGINRFGSSNTMTVEDHHYYKNLLEKNENFESYLKAQMFLNNCKGVLLSYDKGSYLAYNSDKDFKDKIEEVHSIDYYIKRKDFKRIQKFEGLSCQSSHMINITSLSYNKIKFITINTYLKTKLKEQDHE